MTVSHRGPITTTTAWHSAKAASGRPQSPTCLDTLDVDEHALRPEVGDEVVVKASGVTGSLLSDVMKIPGGFCPVIAARPGV